VLDVLADVPRAGFVPPDLVHRAYDDEPLPIPHGQVTTQPSLTAQMIEALALDGSERVLEVGTGYGFQTALLGRLANEVWSVERFADLAAVAEDNLALHEFDNAHVVVGDGSRGLREHAPYDAVIVAAAFPAIPAPLEEQLAPGGRLVQPIGPGGQEEVILFEKGPKGMVELREVTGARFVRLVGRHGYAPETESDRP
jgi:protein-L-isoaspartate(D-aspartate) O-methyltransferase